MAGFTLVELLLTIAILGALSMVALPAFNEMIRTNRLTVTTNQLIGTLSLARSEAVKQGRNVTLCQRLTSGAETCETSSTLTGTWSPGWVIFKGDMDGDPDPDSDSDVIQVREALKGGVVLSVVDDTTNSATDFITFAANGRVNRRTTLTICDPNLGRAKQVFIGNTGRLRSGDSTC